MPGDPGQESGARHILDRLAPVQLRSEPEYAQWLRPKLTRTCERRRITPPIMAKPAIIIVRAGGSGTPDDGTTDAGRLADRLSSDWRDTV